MQYEEFRAQLTLDPKGRLTLPVQLRGELAKRDIDRLVGIAEGGRLLLFTPDDYRRIIKGRVQDPDPFAPSTATYVRAVVSTNTTMPVDAQGRLLVAPHLRELASLDRDIVMYSSLHWVEVWNKERYDQQFTQALQDWDRQRGGG
jgi:MraZ protein